MKTRSNPGTAAAPAKRPSAAGKVTKPAQPKPFTLAPTTSVATLFDEDGSGDKGFRRLLYEFSTASAHLESAREYLASRLGVTSPQYKLVMVIAQYEGAEGISISDVASHLGVSGAFVTTEIKKLVRDGLVVKLSNPTDGRGVLLRLSPQGEERVHALQPDLLQVNDQLFGSLSVQDFRHLSRIVGGLVPIFGQTVAVLRAFSAGGGASTAAASPFAPPAKPAAKRKRAA